MAQIQLVDSTSSSVLLRIIELTYLNSYNTLYNSSYPRYGNITITLSGAGSQALSVQNVGEHGGNTNTVSFTGLNPNTTYTVSAQIVYYNDNYPSNPSSWGTSTLTLNVTTASSTRPPTFSWTYSKVSGGNMNLTASEWNSLCSNINLVRVYKGVTNYGFILAYSGETFTASYYNAAVYAIRGISGYSSALTLVYSGDTVYAYLLNNLVSLLNSIT